MLNLRKAQMTAQKTENQYKISIDTVKWTEIYKNESEIIADLKNIHIPTENEMIYLYNVYKGNEYINSFARQLQAGKELTEKQLTQCKRLALEIKKAVSIVDCFK